MQYTGYWNEAPMDDRTHSYNFDFLEEEYEGTVLSAMMFLHGWCDVFAHALMKMYHKQGLKSEVVFMGGFGCKLIHAYTKTEKDGEVWYSDIRGVINDEWKLLDEFQIVPDDKTECSWLYYSSLSQYYKKIELNRVPKKVRRAAETFIKLPIYQIPERR